jgi:arylsulfatase A-like enzyme
MDTDTPPNVLIVLLDDVGVDQVSPYGYPGSPPTPNIQALADEGIRFDQAWATPVCSPSRAALLTGQYAHRNQVGAVILARQIKELPLAEITLPEMLDLSGTDWTSAAVGKWHLGTVNGPSGVAHARKQGFDLFAGSMNNITGDHSYVSWDRVGFDGVVALETTFSTTKIVDDAVGALGQLREPFLLYVAFHAAHRPLMPPPPELVGGLVVDPGDERALYSANVTAADHEIGRLLGALGDRRERTLVFVMGDNGTPRHAKEDEDMEGAKGSFTEGGLRVPFIVSGPPLTEKGASDALVSLVDVYPTLMELAGVQSVDAQLDGLSLVPVFHDLSRPVHTRLYSETRFPADGPPWRNVSRAARDSSLKVVDHDGQRAVYRITGFEEAELRRSQLSGTEKKRVRKLEGELDEHGR